MAEGKKKKWRNSGGFFPFVYLGQWRVTEIVKRQIVLWGTAFHEGKENVVQDKGSV